ncbi:LuxR family transcriptional regulator [Acrocarpospora phusangensis]|uniref:LuxR family transcriptional regulator n=1 Tax=Acrocarpospora phusangensis TaxID=1070424 RepID=A0A919UM37_9ACTN|nr:AAA family ATPase [Acrocarpospora phusangensis]GIH22892.1 LuxR family transcriptional regulator [Acrocarpospora phusangensis]
MTILTDQRETLVGRVRERATLAAQLDLARAGSPRLVLVEGPCGMGKTALVRSALAEAPGFFALTASGEEMETGLPYGVAAQLLALAGRPGPSADGGPVQAGGLLLEVLGELQEHGPVAIVVDDAHWADCPSLHALTFALRRLRADRVLVVVVTREGSDARLPEGLRRLLADAVRLTLAGLSVAELGDLAARAGLTLSAAALARLRSHTAGNPFYAGALLRQAPAEVLADPLGSLPAPRPYAGDVADRLARLGAETRALVEAASVLGESCPLWQAERLAGTADAIVLLDEAVDLDLLAHRFAAGDLMVTFPHPLTRAAVYQGLRPRDRTRLHRDAAKLVTDGTTRLRHRMRAVLRADDGLAAEMAELAREQAAGGLWESAADHLAGAAQLTTSRRERALCHAEAVHALLQSGQVERAAEIAAGPIALPAARAFVSGALEQVTGDSGRALTLLEAAWEHCDPEAEPILAGRIAGSLSLLHLVHDRAESALTWSRRALALAAPGAGLLPYFQAVSAFLCGHDGQVGELPDPAIATAGERDTLIARGAIRTWSGDLEGAHADLGGVVAGVAPGDMSTRLLATALLAQAEVRLGRWDDALAHGTLVVSLEEDCGQYWLTPYVNALLVWPLAARGEFGAAEARLRDVRTPSVAAGGYLATAAAFLAAVRGDADRVIAALWPLTRIRHASGISEPGVLPWPDLLVEALVAAGRPEEAQAVHDRYAELAAARRRRPAMAALARARAALHAARGETAEAVAAFEEAARGATPFERARTEFAHGAFLRRAGRRGEAAARLTVAHTLFEELRALPYLERCAQELKACGRSPAAPSGDRHEGLTAQENVVARLAVAGLGNKQIAREMMLSVKTVEYHMTNILAKLGIPSRAALAARLRIG